MEQAIGVAITACGLMFILAFVAGWAIRGWTYESQERRSLRFDHDRLCENLHTQRNISDELRGNLNQFFSLADELRGIEREDD